MNRRSWVSGKKRPKYVEPEKPTMEPIQTDQPEETGFVNGATTLRMNAHERIFERMREEEARKYSVGVFLFAMIVVIVGIAVLGAACETMLAYKEPRLFGLLGPTGLIGGMVAIFVQHRLRKK